MADVLSPINAFGLELNKSRFVSGEELIPWLRVDYKIDELINEFWGLQTKSNLIAVSKDINNSQWRGLVSDWDSFGEQPGQFRLNKSFLKNVLDISLGESPRPFDLKAITQLEMSCFENFFVELENFWKDYWRVAQPNSHGNLTFLIWAIEMDNHEIGNLAIGVPPGLVPRSFEHNEVPINLRALANELNVSAPIDLDVGKTRISIHDLKHIEAGDLLVFEDSDVRMMTWKKTDLHQLVIRLVLPEQDESGAGTAYMGERTWDSFFLDNLEIEAMVEKQQMKDDLLADLPIELTAQFKGVNMPLQKMMELEAGGVLPLGLLLDSELVLMAPGSKPIAQGSLVVVGNQFGMKINKVNLHSGSGNIPQAKLSEMPDLNPSLLDKAVASAGVAEAAREEVEEHSQMGDFAAPGMEMGGMAEEPRAQDDLASQLDQELADIGIEPGELDELDELEDEDF